MLMCNKKKRDRKQKVKATCASIRIIEHNPVIGNKKTSFDVGYENLVLTLEIINLKAFDAIRFYTTSCELFLFH